MTTLDILERGARGAAGPGAVRVRNQANLYPDNVLLNLANVRAQEEETKLRPTLFGPALAPTLISGAVNRGDIVPPKEAKPISPHVVNDWVSRSRNSHKGTTTLQALVNLKSSSLRLSPLSVESQDGNGAPTVYDVPHGLEFRYDCDAPKCKITVNAMACKSVETVSAPASGSGLAAYEATSEGGFGRTLRLEDGATLELSSIASQEPETSSSATVPPSPSQNAVASSQSPRKRLSSFPFRSRAQRSDVSGPALRVVDVDAVTDPATLNRKEDQTFVRVTIYLEALDENGQPMPIRNVQTTTLNILPSGYGASEGAEDTRHWVVHVARKDARIGSSSFRLQDIYGLSDATHPRMGSPASEPNTELDSNAYPPTAVETPTTDIVAEQDEIRSECTLCLSSPREVVLLPCRHLVACKECALNMVEYGAGGQIVQPTDVTGEEGSPGAGNGGGEEGGEAGGSSTVPTVTPPSRSRRRRRAKGWYCPICRQPYTSLLRITTTQQKPSLSSQSHLPDSAPAVGMNLLPPGLSDMPTAARPGFLRGLSSRNQNAPAVATTGVEHPLQLYEDLRSN